MKAGAHNCSVSTEKPDNWPIQPPGPDAELMLKWENGEGARGRRLAGWRSEEKEEADDVGTNPAAANPTDTAERFELAVSTQYRSAALQSREEPSSLRALLISSPASTQMTKKIVGIAAQIELTIAELICI